MAMICVDGPAILQITAISCDSFPKALPQATDLGVTESGVQISVGGQVHRVMSDDMGGSEGMPAELLYMGATASIRGVMVKYEANAFTKLVSGLNMSATEGRVLVPGTPMFAGSYGFGLVIKGRAKSFYFPKCELISQPREFNISTTERKTSFTATAYPVYDACTTGEGYLYATFTGAAGCPDQCVNAYGGAVPIPKD